MDLLTSPDNRYLRLARSLTQARNRHKYGLYRLEGVKLVGDALAAGTALEFVLYAPEAAAKNECRALLSRLQARGVACHAVADRLWPGLSATVTPQGILAVARQAESGLGEVLARSQTGLFLVLDGVQDPGNAGTLLRTAAAAGCDGVVALVGTTDLYGDKVLRAAAGAQFFLPLVTGVEHRALTAAARATGKTLVLATQAGGQHYASFNWVRALVLVVANEGRGPSPAMAHAAGELVTVPIERVESLNVAVAAAVLLFEAARQRRGSCE